MLGKEVDKKEKRKRKCVDSEDIERVMNMVTDEIGKWMMNEKYNYTMSHNGVFLSDILFVTSLVFSR